MAKAKNPVTFARQFGVAESKLAKLGVFNSTLAIDTKLFIDPMLLKHSEHIAFSKQALAQYEGHFQKIIKLLKGSQSEGDAAWKGAAKLLSFPEVAGTCLGYGAGTIRGSGLGPKLTSRILKVASEIIAIGVEDVDLFAAMSLFESDIGPDRISDMVTNIIVKALSDFNEEVLSKLNISGQEYTINNINCYFVANPFEKDTPIILLPFDILRDLPIARDWDGVADAARKNAMLRDEVNRHISHIWAKKTKRDKGKLKEAALKDKAAFHALLGAVRGVTSVPYDSVADPEGLTRWASVGADFANQFPINFTSASVKSLDDAYKIVLEIIEQFRHLIEHQGLNKELYSEKKPRHEGTSQRLFFAVAHAYCRANNIDVSPEIDTGNGKIDFKFSTGFNQRVLVEIKLSKNPNVVSGYTTQLEVYKKAQQTMRAVYLVVDVGSMGRKDQKILQIKNEAAKRGEPLSQIEFVDGTLKKSASVRKRLN